MLSMKDVRHLMNRSVQTLTRNDIAHWAERFITTLAQPPRLANWPFGLDTAVGQ